MVKMRDKVYILWTGGWDSTYRMVELSQMDVDIIPIYIIDTTRPSRDIERKTMEKLRTELCNDSRTIAKIEPVIEIKISDLPESKAIADAYQRIQKEIRLGTQYEFLARLALKYPGIEIGIEKPNGEFSGCYEAINHYGRLIYENGVFQIDKSNSSKDLVEIFGNVTFPIIDKTEIDMLSNIKKWDYVNLMKGIHFCHKPRHNEPCGACRPCQQKMECGMEFLLPPKAQFRYRVYKWRLEKGSIFRRIIWKLVYFFI